MTVDEAFGYIADKAVKLRLIGEPLSNVALAQAGKALRDEIGRLKALTEPVDCGERLPEETGGFVLVWSRHLDAWDIITADYAAANLAAHTHWLPLPAAPSQATPDGSGGEG